ncbi:hypothetical protein [Ensifer sp. SL37]|uniref:hypothetical protein n=1 Tax=Ensifer sp. SL37 TaxID=2995137 RepID=UPI0022747674|nr:hypothetical protein [Ensifer sp. SL37]MCY1740888.1 hypothetical protein [Ensifer sp. SL37]
MTLEQLIPLAIYISIFLVTSLPKPQQKAGGSASDGPNDDHCKVLALATNARDPGLTTAITRLNFSHEKATLAVLFIGAMVSFPYVRGRPNLEKNG